MEAKLTAGLWAMAAAFALCASQAQAGCVCNYSDLMRRAPIINSGADNDITIEGEIAVRQSIHEGAVADILNLKLSVVAISSPDHPGIDAHVARLQAVGDERPVGGVPPAQVSASAVADAEPR